MLKGVAQETYLQLKQVLGESVDSPLSPPLPPPPSSSNTATAQNDILALLVTIKNCTVSLKFYITSHFLSVSFQDAAGRKPWTNFRKLPPMVRIQK